MCLLCLSFKQILKRKLARKWQNYRKYLSNPSPQLLSVRIKYTPKNLKERLERESGSKKKRNRRRQLYYNENEESDNDQQLIIDENSNGESIDDDSDNMVEE